jgi:CheY-like chemotaxis protein
MKVLLVDDEQKFAAMLAKRLGLRGIDAHFVFSGAEAIDKVKQGERFDVAVLDVKMPGIGGIELRRELCKLDPELKFVFLTGHGSSLDFEVGTSEAAYYLPKPLKIDNLVETLQKIVGEAALGA